MVGVIENRVRQPGAALYLMTTPAGERIAGNIENVAPDVLSQPGEYEIPYETTLRDLLDYWRQRIATEGDRFLTR